MTTAEAAVAGGKQGHVPKWGQAGWGGGCVAIWAQGQWVSVMETVWGLTRRHALAGGCRHLQRACSTVPQPQPGGYRRGEKERDWWWEDERSGQGEAKAQHTATQQPIMAPPCTSSSGSRPQWHQTYFCRVLGNLTMIHVRGEADGIWRVKKVVDSDKGKWGQIKQVHPPSGRGKMSPSQRSQPSRREKKVIRMFTLAQKTRDSNFNAKKCSGMSCHCA